MTTVYKTSLTFIHDYSEMQTGTCKLTLLSVTRFIWKILYILQAFKSCYSYSVFSFSFLCKSNVFPLSLFPVECGMWTQVKWWTHWYTTVRLCCTWDSMTALWWPAQRYGLPIEQYKLIPDLFTFSLGSHHSCVGHEVTIGHWFAESSCWSQSSSECGWLWW